MAKGKKKKAQQKQRRLQQQVTKQTLQTSRGTGEPAKPIASGPCVHLHQAFPYQIQKLINKLKSMKPFCSSCCLISHGNKKLKTGPTPNQEGVWLCLACAHMGCGMSHLQHAPKHSNSNSKHSLAMSVQTLECWCFKCMKKIILPEISKTTEEIESEIAKQLIEDVFASLNIGGLTLNDTNSEAEEKDELPKEYRNLLKCRQLIKENFSLGIQEQTSSQKSTTKHSQHGKDTKKSKKEKTITPMVTINGVYFNSLHFSSSLLINYRLLECKDGIRSLKWNERINKYWKHLFF
jgi:hypothetical protein